MLKGDLFIAGERRAVETRFAAYDPAAGTAIADVQFAGGSESDVADACAAAEAAFFPYSTLPLERRAAFLEAIADEIEALGDTLVDRASRESGLPAGRIRNERGRTAGQLRLFAAEVRDGQWQKIRVDHADETRAPRKPDLRVRMVPLGPVAVFGASNFPLAFSTAGGDTASALAAGCPVVVKGHRAHPGTGELIATAIYRAADKTGMPRGVFSMINGTSRSVGEALVADSRICAVGFTGSRTGGEALMRIAAARARPIPVYAEMSAINPVILLPSALAARAEGLADEYVASLTLGAGQFCTNPGLVLAIDSPALDTFAARAAAALAGVPAQVMLSDGIWEAYESARSKLGASAHVATLAEGLAPEGPNRGQAALYSVAGKDFLSDPAHSAEVFGASSLIVRCANSAELHDILLALEGQLTATLQIGDGDEAAARALFPLLEQRVGRIIVNGWPTGVEVTHAMVHGGPYPATSDPRSTSVGTLAIDRFLRPVSYQDMPDDLLPSALREAALGGTLARIDGKWTV